jgi:hypothetical protein
MNDVTKAKILQMLAEGTITAVQADELLDALEEPVAQPGRAALEGPDAEWWDVARKVEALRTAFGHRWEQIWDELDAEESGAAVAARAPVPPVPPVPSRSPVPPVPPRVPVPPRPSAAPRAMSVVKTKRKERAGRRPDFDTLVQLSIHGISPDFVRRVREAGLGDLDVNQIVELGIHGVDPDYIAKMRETLGDELGFSELVQLQIHGVSADYVADMRARLGEQLGFDELLELAIHGVDAGIVKEYRDAGVDLSFGRHDVSEAPESDAPEPKPKADASEAVASDLEPRVRIRIKAPQPEIERPSPPELSEGEDG